MYRNLCFLRVEHTLSNLVGGRVHGVHQLGSILMLASEAHGYIRRFIATKKYEGLYHGRFTWAAVPFDHFTFGFGEGGGCFARFCGLGDVTAFQFSFILFTETMSVS